MLPVKIAIVEDNPVTVRSLVQTIDWQAIACTIVGTAVDGVAGKELILAKQPDIVLTDIRMPRMDGLQMVEEVRAVLPDIKFIIITAYDQFQYASRAIKLAVFDYVLKPVRNDEVIKAVPRAQDMMRRQREKDEALDAAGTLRMKAQMLSLLTNPSHAGQAVHQMLTDAGLDSPAYYLMVVQPRDSGAIPLVTLNGMDDMIAACRVRSLSVVLYDSIVLYVMRDNEGEQWRGEAESICDKLSDALPVPVSIGISMLESSHHRIRQTYQQARHALLESTLTRGGEPVFYGESPMGNSAMADIRGEIDTLIEQAELTEESADHAARVLVTISGKQYSQLRAQVSLYGMLLTRKFPTTDAAAVDQALSAAWFVTSESDVQTCLRALTETLLSARKKAEPPCSLLTKNVLDYIRLHGAEKLQLNDVANKFHVSVNYLSAIISKETGVTFHEHVLRAKMDIAHTMLADPRILVEEVARAVGYSNYVSFYNQFKRMEGMTPTEYRNKLARQ